MNQQIKTWVGAVVIIILAVTIGVITWKIIKLKQGANAPVLVSSEQKNTTTTGLANPASTYCTQNSGTLEIRTGADGGQVGICKFTDGSECEEWAYMRGECKVGDNTIPAIDTSDWQTYRNEKYGFEFKYPKDLTVNINTNSIQSNKNNNYLLNISIEEKNELPLDQSYGQGGLIEKGVKISMAGKEGVRVFSCDVMSGDDCQNLPGDEEILKKPNKVIISNNNLFLYIVPMGSFPEELFNQILSTFKFIN